ncbi:MULTISPECIES: DUF536 domain-containing protein [Mammaliicoccus]|uniref:DUF536 domain-containing protein n=1 Tax=Mammaliicoccus TaxID=2803850 RepID=UPI000D1F9FAD|nr:MULTISPECIES: DUF536 domain-containing protein [Mammaliicoccus]MDT3994126.1 DUF536 domain-containing protein [Mammaliicoccus fleurettii]MEB7781413.1 DUF536 domain-containing protein [Mammaliicoccus fleurettii]MEB7807386.1 DUF536 domain-containing protein [Mammaliicoccus fleurettii]PTI36114.1 DUF536 domain-containing protein [Mammaliicoccus vitulinus]
MKSVKILSEELGVSKQTIFNNIKRLNIETIKQENTSFIKKDNDIEKIIQRVNENKKKYGFESTNEDKETKKSNNTNVESKSDFQVVEILKNQIDTLNDQIEKQENRHETTIEFYRKELQERSKLLENQQILALESNKKIQKLENQLEEERQLNYSFDTATSYRQKVNRKEENFTENLQNINQKQEGNQPTEVDIEVENIPEEKKDELSKEDKVSKKIEIERDDKENEPPKKGFWNRFLGKK